MESEKEWIQHIDKLEKITKKYRDKYYATFVKKYTLTKNYADFDVKNDKFVLDKDNYRSATKYAATRRKFGNWCNYNCKSGKLLAEQLMVECTETVTCLDQEDLNSSDDEWETEESSDDGWDWEASDDEMEDLGSTFHERQSENKENNSKEYSLVKQLAAISLNEKTEICPLSRRRATPTRLDGNKKKLRNNDRTRFPTLAKQVSTVQTEAITDDAVKGPLGIGKSVHKRKETLISLEGEKKYFRSDILKEFFVNLRGSNDVSTIAETRGLVRNCFVCLTRFDEGSADAKCQPLNSEICSEMRATEEPNKTCVQASSERIVQISNVKKSRGKKFVKCRKSSVRYCKSVYNVKSLIQHGQFSPSCSCVQLSLDRSYLAASFNEDYDSSYLESPRKGKRKSKITEFDDELPSPKRSSNAASNEEYHSNIQKYRNASPFKRIAHLVE